MFYVQIPPENGHETTPSGGSETALKNVDFWYHEKRTLLILLFGLLCIDCTRVKIFCRPQKYSIPISIKLWLVNLHS